MKVGNFYTNRNNKWCHALGQRKHIALRWSNVSLIPFSIGIVIALLAAIASAAEAQQSTCTTPKEKIIELTEGWCRDYAGCWKLRLAQWIDCRDRTIGEYDKAIRLWVDYAGILEFENAEYEKEVRRLRKRVRRLRRKING